MLSYNFRYEKRNPRPFGQNIFTPFMIEKVMPKKSEDILSGTDRILNSSNNTFVINIGKDINYSFSGSNRIINYEVLKE